MLHEALTQEIIGVFYNVYNELGHGFLENVYQNALFFALKEQGLKVTAQQKIPVYFRGKVVGNYFADLVVEDLVILELKAADGITKAFEQQLVHYLRSTTLEVGLLLNFGPIPGVCRKVYDNEIKPDWIKNLLK